MSGYIRVDKDLLDDPRVIEVADVYAAVLEHQVLGSSLSGAVDNSVDNRDVRNALRSVTRNAVVGALVQLWCYADTHIRADNALPITLARLSQVLQVPVELLQQLPASWLRSDVAGATILPDYVDKNLLSAREVRREKGRERIRRYRQKTKLEGAVGARQHTTENGNGAAPFCNAPVTHPRAGAGGRARTRVPDPNPYPNSEPQPLGTAKGRNGALERTPNRRPRSLRAASLRIWDALLSAIDEVQHSTAGLTWAYVEQQLNDRNAYLIAERIGFPALAQRTKYTLGDHKRRFRELYEQLLERAGDLNASNH